jgi:hypothetical protein
LQALVVQALTAEATRIDNNRGNDEDMGHGVFRKFVARNIKIFGYTNNDYGGHAPETVNLFQELWEKKR